MRHSFDRWSTQILCLLLLVTASCVRKQQAVETPAQTAVSVSDIDLGRAIDANKQVSDKTNEFTPGETAYVSVITVGTAPNTEIKARWTFEDGQIVDESTQTISPTETTATEFHVSKPDGWPAGKYKVEIFVNGASAGSKDFTVKAS
jgi:hypothetical protein